MQETLEPIDSQTPLSLSQTLSGDPAVSSSILITNRESSGIVLEDKLSNSPSKVSTSLGSSEFPLGLEGDAESLRHRDTVQGTDSINLDSPVKHKDMGYMDLVGRRGLGDGVTTPHSVKTLLNTLSVDPAADNVVAAGENSRYSSNAVSEGYVGTAGKDQQQGDFVTDIACNPLDCPTPASDDDVRSFGMPAHSLDFDLSAVSDTSKNYMGYTPDQSLDVLDFETSHLSEDSANSTPTHDSEVVMFDFEVPSASLEVKHDTTQYIGHGLIHDDQSDSLHYNRSIHDDQSKSPLQLDYVLDQPDSPHDQSNYFEYDQSDSPQPTHNDLSNNFEYSQSDSPQLTHNDQSNYFRSDRSGFPQPTHSNQSNSAHYFESDQSHYVGPAHKQLISSHYVGSASDQSDSSHLYAKPDLESLHYAWSPDEAVKQASDMATDFEISSLDALPAFDADFMPPKFEASSFELDKELSTFCSDVGRGGVVNLDGDSLAYSNGESTSGYIATLDTGFPSSFAGGTELDHTPSSADIGKHISSVGDTKRSSVLCNLTSDHLSEPFSLPPFPHCVSDLPDNMTTPFNRLTGQNSSGFSYSTCTSSESGYVVAGGQFYASEQ